MKRLSVSLLCLFALFACGQPERPVFDERPFIDLSGIWQCDLGDIRLPGTVDESGLAPLTGDTLRTMQLTRLRPYVGKMTYTRDVEIPDTLAGKQWRLVMERTKPSVVRIDGDSIGASSLLLSPQEYVIGPLSPGHHTLCIEIDNGPRSVPGGIQGSHAWTDATQTNWNGVIGRFGLEADDGITIESLQAYPTVDSPSVPLVARIRSSVEGRAEVTVKGYVYNTDRTDVLPMQTLPVDLREGTHTYTLHLGLGHKPACWSEFDPALYRVNAMLTCDGRTDYYTTSFGVRDFQAAGTQFSINGLTTFLRGKHDGCVFPLTGYPPMEKEAWAAQFRLSKQYGINHYRFHSWTPPRAAFEAADEEGIYLQAELPYWGTMKREQAELNDFLLAEGRGLLAAYGNHPSFVMMALGNELGGDYGFMREITEGFRSSDQRRLYAFGSNNGLGTGGQQPGEDFFVTCRVGGQVGSDDYSMHTRATFSFADAKDGGYMNATYPSADRTFDPAVAACSVPIISHENGQFQVYPDYGEIAKYTGVLYPYNLEVFRRRLEAAGMGDQADVFHRATARFAAMCYKADIEMCLRTPGFGGFQLLDLQDYPGQGSAYVGLLDAFMDSKGGITPEEFSGFCSDIVPLAVFPKYCWEQGESFTATVEVANYSATALKGKTLRWSLQPDGPGEVLSEGAFPIDIPQGKLQEDGRIDIPLAALDTPVQLRLTLEIDGRTNGYDLWAYPAEAPEIAGAPTETTSLVDALLLLEKGEKVLFVPDHTGLEAITVGGLFTPDYWNYAMFKSISESLHRDVSPGTLSVLTDPAHPLFAAFPTDMCSNWQWWIILRNARPLILDLTPASYRPLVQLIDNIERNHKLGLLFEMQVGEGRLLVSMCDLAAIADTPEGRQFRQAILQYMASDAFAPAAHYTPQAVRELFQGATVVRNIRGVKNITTYE